MKTTTFESELYSVDGRNTAIRVSAQVLDEWGVGKRVPVIVSVNGFEYRSTIAPMGGQFLIPFSSDKRAATGLGAGDEITVTLTHDTAERTVDVPDDLAAALDAAGLRPAFDALAFTFRKEHARAVVDAKKPETRQRRIEAVIAKLGG
ncbi:YdeI/OmpD-associated family protein [Microbacterium nymphoidis]|uniref:YdeI/OmpD-associated family protein n=1 Tax=Microbacterium nymphoidis TaxID=2898586 RepID=UPI001E30ACA5|nr:YdeI/OmpD-associated family protein [Microbacterium nymphoidis]MCD2497809.1 YdeI/OmpD-associated family protein [Microbacterium nymphoidis]